jgi:N-methylhydantoinase B
MRLLADEGKLTNLSERQRFAPWGLFGGRPGRPARTVVNPGPDQQAVHGKQSREFAYGDVISFQQSGAGGYGDPLDRDPARVLEDVLDEYVSVDAARTAYGVVIVSTAEPDVDVTGIALLVDTTATLELRRQMKSARGT